MLQPNRPTRRQVVLYPSSPTHEFCLIFDPGDSFVTEHTVSSTKFQTLKTRQHSGRERDSPPSVDSSETLSCWHQLLEDAWLGRIVNAGSNPGTRRNETHSVIQALYLVLDTPILLEHVTSTLRNGYSGGSCMHASNVHSSLIYDATTCIT